MINKYLNRVQVKRILHINILSVHTTCSCNTRADIKSLLDPMNNDERIMNLILLTLINRASMLGLCLSYMLIIYAYGLSYMLIIMVIMLINTHHAYEGEWVIIMFNSMVNNSKLIGFIWLVLFMMIDRHCLLPKMSKIIGKWHQMRTEMILEWSIMVIWWSVMVRRTTFVQDECSEMGRNDHRWPAVARNSLNGQQ